MPHWANNFLIAVSGLSWMLVYTIAIVRGAIDKSYAIPLPALIANVAWELLYGTVFADKAPCGRYVALLWLGLDIPIFVQALYYRRNELFNMSESVFALAVGGGFATCIGLFYYSEIDGLLLTRYAFPQNLMMSILFMHMMMARENARGQSLYIALFKAVGTSSVIACSAWPINAISGCDVVMFLGIMYFDLIYIVMLYNKLQRLGLHPWRRF